ncbi:MAG: type I-E CRISPR-associated protein Cas5/CasD [Pseudoramibacter sp.]|jgi:CRISPR system Cascade subunit CasD
MGRPILCFRLEGPLQSWGEHAKWDYRDTANFPTKSGVVGLIACAMGLERRDPEIGALSDRLTMAARADRRGELLMDYHTVFSENMKKADGKFRGKRYRTIESHRGYLQDASFLIGLASDRSTLETIQHALAHPKWTIYLGRKSCVPSVPILGTITDQYDDLRQAMQRMPLEARHDAEVMIQIEDTRTGQVRMDNRVASTHRLFAQRYVQHERYRTEEA